MIVKDGIENIDLFQGNLPKQGIATIAEKISHFTNPVNLFIILKLCCSINALFVSCYLAQSLIKLLSELSTFL